jgi:hypothetical protein
MIGNPVERVVDWHNHVALMCSGQSWRFQNTETTLSSQTHYAHRAIFLRLGNDSDDDIFAPFSCSAALILCFSVSSPRLLISAFVADNPFRSVLVFPNVALEVSKWTAVFFFFFFFSFFFVRCPRATICWFVAGRTFLRSQLEVYFVLSVLVLFTKKQRL